MPSFTINTVWLVFFFRPISINKHKRTPPQRTIHNTVPEVAATAHPLAQRKVMINVMMAYSCRYFSASFQDFHLRMSKAVYNHSIPRGTMTWDLTSGDRTLKQLGSIRIAIHWDRDFDAPNQSLTTWLVVVQNSFGTRSLITSHQSSLCTFQGKRLS